MLRCSISLGGQVNRASEQFQSLPLIRTGRQHRSVWVFHAKRLRDAVESVVPAGTPLPPGTAFGPLVGTASGRFGDFAWMSKWKLFLQQTTLAKLESAGIRSLIAVPAQLSPHWQAGSAPELLELHIEPGAWLVDGARKVEPCSGCGRREFSKPKDRPLVIDRATVPAGRTLFRLGDLSTHIIATREFRDAVAQFQFSNIAFEDIEVA